MSVRFTLSGGMLIVPLLLLLVAGCTKHVPMSPDVSETQTTEGTEDTTVTSQESAEELAARRAREMQAAIEERERKVVEESMRRRFGDPAATTTPPTMSQEEFVHQDVHFSYDSHTLSEEAKARLEQKAAWLTERSNISVQIEGHCDERGTTVYNLVLGERRAHTVKQYLAALGISASRLSIISYGEEFPLDPAHTEEAWFRNRRAHFVITSQ